MELKNLKRSKLTISGLVCVCAIIILYSYHSALLSTKFPTRQGLNDNYRLAAINPRDVFLLFTKTQKTSSTVVSSLIMEAYTRYGIPIANDARQLEVATPGTFASIKHREFRIEAIGNITKLTGKQVILVVSIREGADWLVSYIAHANRETSKVANGSYVPRDNLCSRFSPKRSASLVQGALDRYLNYLPVEKVAGSYNPKTKMHSFKLSYKPWAVIRHEHVVDDTCELLKRLGMECNRNALFGQASRKDVGYNKCKYTPDASVVDNVNKINQILWKARAEDDGIIRG